MNIFGLLNFLGGDLDEKTYNFLEYSIHIHCNLYATLYEL